MLGEERSSSHSLLPLVEEIGSACSEVDNLGAAVARLFQPYALLHGGEGSDKGEIQVSMQHRGKGGGNRCSVNLSRAILEHNEVQSRTHRAVVSIRDTCNAPKKVSTPFIVCHERLEPNSPLEPQMIHLPPYVPKLHSSQILTSSAGRT